MGQCQKPMIIIMEGYQIGQAQLSLGESTLTTLYHLLVVDVPGSGSQD